MRTRYQLRHRKRVPGSILYEANRLECLFYWVRSALRRGWASRSV